MFTWITVARHGLRRLVAVLPRDARSRPPSSQPRRPGPRRPRFDALAARSTAAPVSASILRLAAPPKRCRATTTRRRRAALRGLRSMQGDRRCGEAHAADARAHARAARARPSTPTSPTSTRPTRTRGRRRRSRPRRAPSSSSWAARTTPRRCSARAATATRRRRERGGARAACGRGRPSRAARAVQARRATTPKQKEEKDDDDDDANTAASASQARGTPLRAPLPRRRVVAVPGRQVRAHARRGRGSARAARTRKPPPPTQRLVIAVVHGVHGSGGDWCDAAADAMWLVGHGAALEKRGVEVTARRARPPGGRHPREAIRGRSLSSGTRSGARAAPRPVQRLRGTPGTAAEGDDASPASTGRALVFALDLCEALDECEDGEADEEGRSRRRRRRLAALCSRAARGPCAPPPTGTSSSSPPSASAWRTLLGYVLVGMARNPFDRASVPRAVARVGERGTFRRNAACYRPRSSRGPALDSSSSASGAVGRGRRVGAAPARRGRARAIGRDERCSRGDVVESVRSYNGGPACAPTYGMSRHLGLRPDRERERPLPSARVSAAPRSRVTTSISPGTGPARTADRDAGPEAAVRPAAISSRSAMARGDSRMLGWRVLGKRTARARSLAREKMSVFQSRRPARRALLRRPRPGSGGYNGVARGRPPLALAAGQRARRGAYRPLQTPRNGRRRPACTSRPARPQRLYRPEERRASLSRQCAARGSG